MTAPLAQETSKLGSADASSWSILFEELLAGIIHSMNNVITVLSVSLELGPGEGATAEQALLQRELARLQELIELISALSIRSRRTEALELRGVLDTALTIHALSPTTRGILCTTVANGVIPPVRVPRSVLLRVLLLLIDAAKHADAGANTAVTIQLSGDAARLTVQAQCGTGLGSEVHDLAAACGGTLTVLDGRALFELPSLETLRRARRL